MGAIRSILSGVFVFFLILSLVSFSVLSFLSNTILNEDFVKSELVRFGVYQKAKDTAIRILLDPQGSPVLKEIESRSRHEPTPEDRYKRAEPEQEPDAGEIFNEVVSKVGLDRIKTALEDIIDVKYLQLEAERNINSLYSYVKAGDDEIFLYINTEPIVSRAEAELDSIIDENFEIIFNDFLAMQGYDEEYMVYVHGPTPEDMKGVFREQISTYKAKVMEEIPKRYILLDSNDSEVIEGLNKARAIYATFSKVQVLTLVLVLVFAVLVVIASGSLHSILKNFGVSLLMAGLVLFLSFSALMSFISLEISKLDLPLAVDKGFILEIIDDILGIPKGLSVLYVVAGVVLLIVSFILRFFLKKKKSNTA